MESRVLLMKLMNIELTIVKEHEAPSRGNSSKQSSKTSFRELFQQRPGLDSRSTKVSHIFTFQLFINDAAE